ncbi:MAG: hypothetical protein LC646_03450 [Xanthomonadaceae bacterium]|nr:hypothetical protein [Xanthomonadaceae bacterium]
MYEIVNGMISPGDAISGSSLMDTNPTLADGTPTQFTTATIIRTTTQGSDFRSIQPNDMVLLFNYAAQADKRRFVAAAPSLSNTLDVTSAYSQDYPNATYTNSEYAVAASMLGASIAGVQEDGTLTPGIATIRDGLATFYITYPANLYTITSGCGISAIDTRIAPVGSSRVYVVARHGGGTLTTIDDTFCFAPIAGFTVEPTHDSVQVASGSTTDVSVCVRDGGDTIRVPFYPISFAAKTDGDAAGSLTILDTDGVTVIDRTNVNGCFIARVGATGASGDSATFTFVVGDGSGEIEVNVQ